MSDIHIETMVFERETSELIAAAVKAESNVAHVSVVPSMFDGAAEIEHDPDQPLPDDLAARIARRLRGGPIDRDRPTQWHVRLVEPLLGWRGNVETRIGTVICLGRTFPVPANYDEEARSWAA